MSSELEVQFQSFHKRIQKTELIDLSFEVSLGIMAMTKTSLEKTGLNISLYNQDK